MLLGEVYLIERIWIQGLGAEASTGAIADMLCKSQRPTNYGRLFGTAWLTKVLIMSKTWFLLSELSVNQVCV